MPKKTRIVYPTCNICGWQDDKIENVGTHILQKHPIPRNYKTVKYRFTRRQEAH